MDRRDRAVVGSLVALLVLIVAAVVVPALGPRAVPASPSGSGTPLPASSVTAESRPYREGVVGAATSINPLTAVSRADRDLVALVFSGLVALGPGETLVPSLATDWTVDGGGRVWTFHLRPDAVWQDGEPVTATDVVFTVAVLQDPSYTGPTAASWRDVKASALDPHTVRFQLSTPLGGFLEAATQPIVPAHLLNDVPVDQLADAPFGREPVGSGPYRLVSLDDTRAILTPVAGSTDTAPAGTDGPPDIELQFFDDAPSLAAAYEAGLLDAASGLPPADAARLGALPGSRLLRYPGSTLTAVVFNLRPSHMEFRDPRVRRALLRGIDRARIIDAAWAGHAVTANVPIPPASWAFDPAGRATDYERRAATKGLAEAGWKAANGAWTRPGSKGAVTVELLSPDVATNPSTFLAAADVAADWQRLGLRVEHVPLPPAELVTQLRPGSFSAAVVDVNVGLDPDLYPLLASTQTTSRGLNVAGLIDPALDKQLLAARGPGDEAVRRAAYKALVALLADRQYLLPIAFRDEVVVVRDSVSGQAIRRVGEGSDRFWDVLTWRLAVGP